MKKIISVMLALLVISIACISVSAASSEAVASVHFDLYPNTDGTLDVTEIWNVEYNGTGEGFTRWIDTNENGLSDIEKYDSITNIAVDVNGSPVSEKSSDINYFKYGTSSDSGSYNIVIVSPSATETKEYKISYTVNGALKRQGKNVCIAYMLIGDTFQYTCNNVTASVHMPQGLAAENAKVNDDAEVLLNNTTVDYNQGRVYMQFAVNITVPGDMFDTASMPVYSSVKNAFKIAGQTLLDVLYVMIIIVAVIAVIVLALFSEKIKRVSVEQKAKKTTDTDVASISDGMSACKTYKMLIPYSRVNPKSTSKKIPALFAMAILECIEKEYIVQKDNDLIVGIPDSENDAYIMSVLNFLITFSEKKFNRYVISSDFAEKIKTECMTNYDSITNYLCSFYELIPDMDSKYLKNADNRKLYENNFVLMNTIKKENCKCTFAQGINAVLDGAKTSDKQIFAMMFTGKVFESSGKSCAAAFADAVSAMYDVFVKSK